MEPEVVHMGMRVQRMLRVTQCIFAMLLQRCGGQSARIAIKTAMVQSEVLEFEICVCLRYARASAKEGGL